MPGPEGPALILMPQNLENPRAKVYELIAPYRDFSPECHEFRDGLEEQWDRDPPWGVEWPCPCPLNNAGRPRLDCRVCGGTGRELVRMTVRRCWEYFSYGGHWDGQVRGVKYPKSYDFDLGVLYAQHKASDDQSWPGIAWRDLPDFKEGIAYASTHPETWTFEGNCGPMADLPEDTFWFYVITSKGDLHENPLGYGSNFEIRTWPDRVAALIEEHRDGYLAVGLEFRNDT